MRSIGVALTLCFILPSIAVAQSHVHRVNQGASSGSAQAKFNSAMTQAMAVMDADMMAAKPTSNPDHDFAAMMIPHHQGAIDMAKSQLLYGSDPVLRRLAQEIIVAQQKEIEAMRRALNATSAAQQKWPSAKRTTRHMQTQGAATMKFPLVLLLLPAMVPAVAG
jgi:hypothetical protein